MSGSEHPYFAACPRCGRATRVKINGTLYQHNREQLLGGSVVATVRCAGSNRPYAT